MSNIAKRLLNEQKENLLQIGFNIEIVPTLDTAITGDMWIILSKEEIHITHRIGKEILNDDRQLYHCLRVMEEEYSNSISKNKILDAKREAIEEFEQELEERRKISTMDSKICTSEMIDTLIAELQIKYQS